MKKQALDIHSAKHPVQQEIDKNLGIINLVAKIEEDKQSLEKFKHIPGGVISFLCTLKKDDITISEGRATAIINKMNKYFERQITFTKNASLVDAVVKSVKMLDALNLDSNSQPNSGIKLEEYQVKDIHNSDLITERQKKYLTQLIHQNCTDKKQRESLVNQLDEMSSAEASRQIKSFL